MKHSFKNPRYRICFQTKNKVWIYKNSRLRNFYKIRNKIILKSGKYAKNFLITKNMKWTVARRQMVPYFRNKNRFAFFYKNLFFTKQQLKNFYGGLKEYQLRNLFKNTWNKEQNFRCNVFVGSLEQRLSVVLFRMRLLPTIFACNQLIKHHGIFVNEKKITLVNFRVKIGDIVSISNNQWFIFYKFVFERLRNRFFGEGLLLWRKAFILKKLRYYRLKKKNVYIVNLRLFKKFRIQLNRYKLTKQFCKKVFSFVKQNSLFENKINKQYSIKILYFFFEKKFTKNILKIKKLLPLLRKWSKKSYFYISNKILLNIYNFKLLLNNFLLIFYKVLISWIVFNKNFTVSKTNKITSKQILEIFINAILLKKTLLQKKQQLSEFKIEKFLQRKLKKTLILKLKYSKYKKYFLFLLRKLKYRKLKKNVFKNWCKKTHWYTPRYLEVDFKTLRASFIYYPEISEVSYGFLCSFKKIISFYKERAL